MEHFEYSIETFGMFLYVLICSYLYIHLEYIMVLGYVWL